MTIYLMQGSDDGKRIDEIEAKLKSIISHLKRVPNLEGIDQISNDGAQRPTVVLVAAAPEIGKVQKLIDFASRGSRNIFFIVVGGDFSAGDLRATHSVRKR